MSTTNKYYEFFKDFETLTETSRIKKLEKLSNGYNLKYLVSIWNDYMNFLYHNPESAVRHFEFSEVREINSIIKETTTDKLKILYFENSILNCKFLNDRESLVYRIFYISELWECINIAINDAYCAYKQNKNIVSVPPVKAVGANPNLWNDNCFRLFNYLKSEYHTTNKRQLTNIWFFLKENTNEKYHFTCTKDNYKRYILSTYNIDLKNFDKAGNKWDKEKITLTDHLKNFETN